MLVILVGYVLFDGFGEVDGVRPPKREEEYVTVHDVSWVVICLLRDHLRSHSGRMFEVLFTVRAVREKT